MLPVTLPKLSKLERLDLGANSFSEFVSKKIQELIDTIRNFNDLASCLNESSVIDGTMAWYE